MPLNCHPTFAELCFGFMGKLIPFPAARVRRPPVDVFAGHFELLSRHVVWDRMTIAALAFIALCAAV